jgi:hypothetical protein
LDAQAQGLEARYREVRRRRRSASRIFGGNDTSRGGQKASAKAEKAHHQGMILLEKE